MSVNDVPNSEKPEQTSEDYVEESDSAPTKNANRHFNKFQLLELVDNSETVDSDQDEPQSGQEDDESIEQQSKQNNSKQRKPRNKRRNKKNKSGNKDAEKELCFEDLIVDNSLNKVSKKNPIKIDDNLRLKLLKLDMRNLIPEAELKRMFGKSVLGEKSRDYRPRGHGVFLRSKFVGSTYSGDLRAIPPTPSPKMELDNFFNDQRTTGTKSSGGEKSKQQQDASIFNSDKPIYFKFVHDASYQEAQAHFLEAAHGGNPESIIQNMNLCPTHVESIIQLSHMFRISEDFKTSSEFIERALMVFERGFHPRFNVATANCRLSYRRPENRTFFITIFEHILYCNRRGLRRTPLEYSKLLLALDPDNDPLFASQLIDFYAIRSEEYDYIIDFIREWNHLSKLPNMKFSLALAYFLKSRCTKQPKTDSENQLKLANEYLQDALLIFPNFIIPLLDACSAEPDSELKKCTYFDYSVYSTKYKLVPGAVDVLVTLYVKRNSLLWKAKHVLAWLEQSVATLVEKFAKKELVDEGKHTQHWASFKGPVPRNLLRHIALSDLKVPVPASAAGATILDTDPYPPPESITSYNIARLDQRTLTSSGGFTTFLRSMLPSFSLENEQAPTARETTSSNNRPTQRHNQRLPEPNEPPAEVVQAQLEEMNRELTLNELHESIRSLVSSFTNLLSFTQDGQIQHNDELNNDRNRNEDQQGDNDHHE